jgi:hypothetical protein
MPPPTAPVIVKANDIFEKMLKSARTQKNLSHDPYGWLIYWLDPGETTGAAQTLPRNSGWQFELTQLDTSPAAFDGSIVPGYKEIEADLPEYAEFYEGKRMLGYEDYRVYGHKADQHRWAGLHTPKLIGAIEVLASIHGWPLARKQMAIEAKTFCDDNKLKMWGVYHPGMKHARDALRHLIYYLFFGLP